MQHITDSVTVMTSGQTNLSVAKHELLQLFVLPLRVASPSYLNHQNFHFLSLIFRILEFIVERKSLLLEILLHYISVLYVFLAKVLPFPKTVEPKSLVFYFEVGSKWKSWHLRGRLGELKRKFCFWFYKLMNLEGRIFLFLIGEILSLHNRFQSI